ncbi:hypothetical protein K8U54_18085 [Pseudomonas fulva]|uniref:hypothetical protein n=1 Tax=Pseudomonas fulva TaxID=47880 RepID=UPI00201D48A8|nr:hypothetical protein [Pseudomonas fulva]UQY33612.1 hypothetical protein K8U54_18085 [Pseudomonas fulva]
MALTEQTRVRQIILDFPTAIGYTLRYREAVDLMRDGVFDQELRVSEPMPVVGVGEPLPSALAELFGQEAGKIILGSHEAALEHEARLQLLADETRRADTAEQQIEEQARRADVAEAKLAAVMKALSPDSAALAIQP